MAFLPWDQAGPLLGLSGNTDAQKWYAQNSVPQPGEAIHNPVPVSTDPHSVQAGNGIHTGLIPVIVTSGTTDKINSGGSTVDFLSSVKASGWFQKILGAMFVLTLLCAVPAIAQQAAPIGPLGVLQFTQNNTAADTIALLPSQMVGLLVGTPTAGATYTTPTATQLCQLFPFVASSNASFFNWLFVVKNTSAGANTITMAGGTGVTLRGTGTIAQSAVRIFYVEVTGCSGTPAANLYSLMTGAF